jgi:hypothetical protein
MHASTALMPLLVPTALAVPHSTQQPGNATDARITRFTATPTTVAASGGSLQLLAVVQRTTTCRFSSSSALKGLPATADCASGRASITVNVPRNTTSAAHSYLLYLTARDAHGASTTMRAVVVERARTSNAAPGITLQPTSQSVFSATRVTLIAAASGNPRPRVQWQVSTNNGAGWKSVAGATSTSWSFTPTPVATGYQYREYRAIFTNSFGSATTAAGTLTISAATAPGVTKGATGTSTAPVITTQPTSQSVSYNAVVTFTAAASGNPTPTAQWQVSTNGGSTWANTSVPFVAITSDNGNEYRAVFTNTAGSATTNTATLTVAPMRDDPNWAGYAATGETFSAVTASWTVPTVTCTPGDNTDSSEWVGIDGISDATVEQDGTSGYCLDGMPTYFSWYELWGDAALNSGLANIISSTLYPLSPGDTITVSATLAAGSWAFDITDSTKGWAFTTTIPSFVPAPLGTSAEWIVEPPVNCTSSSACTPEALAAFSPVSFTGATATGNGRTGPISSFPFTAMQITGGSTVFAAPGPLDAAGDGFTDTWYAN